MAGGRDGAGGGTSSQGHHQLLQSPAAAGSDGNCCSRAVPSSCNPALSAKEGTITGFHSRQQRVSKGCATASCCAHAPRFPGHMGTAWCVLHYQFRPALLLQAYALGALAVLGLLDMALICCGHAVSMCPLWVAALCCAHAAPAWLLMRSQQQQQLQQRGRQPTAGKKQVSSSTGFSRQASAVPSSVTASSVENSMLNTHDWSAAMEASTDHHGNKHQQQHNQQQQQQHEQPSSSPDAITPSPSSSGATAITTLLDLTDRLPSLDSCSSASSLDLDLEQARSDLQSLYRSAAANPLVPEPPATSSAFPVYRPVLAHVQLRMKLPHAEPEDLDAEVLQMGLLGGGEGGRAARCVCVGGGCMLARVCACCMSLVGPWLLEEVFSSA